jgi:peptidoglycan-associated lipoprotein
MTLAVKSLLMVAVLALAACNNPDRYGAGGAGGAGGPGSGRCCSRWTNPP